jgi:hypothetical protein
MGVSFLVWEIVSALLGSVGGLADEELRRQTLINVVRLFRDQ